LIRTRVKEIREMGRSTQGVTLINTGANEKLIGISRIAEEEEEL
jgi:DNA gyrase subunit A